MNHIIRVYEVKKRKELPKLNFVHVVMKKDLDNFLKWHGYEYCNVWIYKNNAYLEPNSWTA